jgi:nuclease-like protein
VRATGPGSRLPSGMPENPQVRGWIWRGVFSAIAFLVVTIFLDWRLGVTAAALVAIFDTFMRRNHARIMLPQSRVAAAQRKTRRTLRGLEKSGWHTLNNRSIPNSDQEIDHFLVGPGGVFAVDSELWDKRMPIRTGGTGRELYHGPYSQTERLEHAQWEAAQATRLVSSELRQRVIVHPAMVLYGPKVPWIVVRMLGVDVFAGDQLKKYLKQEARQRAKASERLDPDQVAEVIAAAEKVLPPRR